ncbi:hypothetical protein KKF59_02015 [Patescibacteria group bacterium]|nr:hypothetical protein [Patescibacteria group bacterium]MBU1907885.1 hypothetical protein [Patescibacteria group bacterium]
MATLYQFPKISAEKTKRLLLADMKNTSLLVKSVLTLVCVSFYALPLPGRAATLNDSLIKSESSAAVYYIQDGKRYAFPNESVYKSWYPDFKTVATVPDAELANYALAGNVTYKPGVKLVKITTDPKVYAVSRYGVLRWIANETLAAALFGSDWNRQVNDLPDTFFINYAMGESINSAENYNRNNEISLMMIADDIRPANFIPPTSTDQPISQLENDGYMTMLASTSQATLNQMIKVAAEVIDSNRPVSRIDIYSDQSTSILATCLNSSKCTFTYFVDRAPLEMRFYAIAEDENGTKLETPYGQQAALSVSEVSTLLAMTVSPSSITTGSRANYSSDASAISGITGHKIWIAIPGQPIVTLWKDCGTQATCAASSPFYRTSQLFSQITADGKTYKSAAATISVSGGAPPAPILTLVEKPTSNQAVLQLNSPSGETIGWSTIVVGTTEDDRAIALCEFSSCEITVQFSEPQTYTAFTDVGGKLEASNSISVSP